MRISQLYPVAVQTYIDGRNNGDDRMTECIVVGKCNTNIYYASDLIFPPILLGDDEVVQRAVLKMFCKRVCGSFENINVCINDSNNCIRVDQMGIYAWDVTKSINLNNRERFVVCAHTKDLINTCTIREFEAFECHTKPVLELTIANEMPESQHRFVNLVKEYWVDDIWKNTEWIDTSWFEDYYFFIENVSGNVVEFMLEISPDKNMVFQDTGPIALAAQETAYLQPMRVAQFLRLSYKNVAVSQSNQIRICFQGKKEKKRMAIS
ncbi:DUF6385 domain-containing protein [Clostridium aminobutyricum]|uniref:DUF6385 domain-containing protein n=1 Tax=Clostridium aminobutyricum TaxID=33953 RepID=A0A939IFS4_CLOAM|nr:DUF6385 domain-containing protein [Clostridium aminobutyricum]MBN7771820.1 hypothetical protein [Clostridium aminobutyricum]